MGTAICHMWPSYRPITPKRSISAGEMSLTICVQWAADNFGLGLTYMYLDPVLMKICAENDFYIFVPSDLDLLPLDLKFVLLVTLVQRYVCTKLEVSTAFLFRENRRHKTDGRTDGQTGCNT